MKPSLPAEELLENKYESPLGALFEEKSRATWVLTGGSLLKYLDAAFVAHFGRTTACSAQGVHDVMMGESLLANVSH